MTRGKLTYHHALNVFENKKYANKSFTIQGGRGRRMIASEVLEVFRDLMRRDYVWVHGGRGWQWRRSNKREEQYG